MKITIIEGARGVGKSTITRKLRDGLTNTLLINMTGNNDDSEEGKKATNNHHANMLSHLSYEEFDETPFNYIFDRSFFSEQVYASLYKNYDFTEHFEKLLRKLDVIASGVEVQVILLTTDQPSLERNLSREGKAHLFGDEKYADNVYKSLTQQAMYISLINWSKKNTQRIKFKELSLVNLSLEESISYVMSQI